MAMPSGDVEAAALLEVLQALEVDSITPEWPAPASAWNSCSIHSSTRWAAPAASTTAIPWSPSWPPIRGCLRWSRTGSQSSGSRGGLALLSYRSVQVPVAGAAALATWRMSLWQQAGGQWQLRYHQGTPAADPG